MRGKVQLITPPFYFDHGNPQQMYEHEFMLYVNDAYLKLKNHASELSR